jgi:hypothetical protein
VDKNVFSEPISRGKARPYIIATRYSDFPAVPHAYSWCRGAKVLSSTGRIRYVFRPVHGIPAHQPSSQISKNRDKLHQFAQILQRACCLAAPALHMFSTASQISRRIMKTYISIIYIHIAARERNLHSENAVQLFWLLQVATHQLHHHADILFPFVNNNCSNAWRDT